LTCCPCSPLSFLFCFLSLPLLPFTFALPLPLLSPCPGLGLPDGFLPALALSLPGWLPPHTWGALRGDLGKLRGALGGTLFSLWVSKFEKCSGCVCVPVVCPLFYISVQGVLVLGRHWYLLLARGYVLYNGKSSQFSFCIWGCPPLLPSGFAPFHAGPSITFDMLPLLSPVLSLLLSVPSPSAFYFCSPLAFAPPLPWPWPARRISPSTCPESARLASTTHLGGGALRGDLGKRFFPPQTFPMSENQKKSLGLVMLVLGSSPHTFFVLSLPKPRFSGASWRRPQGLSTIAFLPCGLLPSASCLLPLLPSTLCPGKSKFKKFPWAWWCWCWGPVPTRFFS
jgi:hypothetical protein